MPCQCIICCQYNSRILPGEVKWEQYLRQVCGPHIPGQMQLMSLTAPADTPERQVCLERRASV